MAKRVKVAEANAHVPGYVPPPVSTYGGHIPLCTTSRIAPTFVRITTAQVVQQQLVVQGFRTVASKAQHRKVTGVPSQHVAGNAKLGCTEVTVIRFGGFEDKEREQVFIKCHPSAFVEAAQRRLNMVSKFPPITLKGCWSATSQTTGNFVYMLSGQHSPVALDHIRDCLCEPFLGKTTLVPAAGWTWAQLCKVPNQGEDSTTYSPAQLLASLSANSCFKGALFPVPPGWFGNPVNFKRPYSDVSFAHIEGNKAITKRATLEGVCMFGRQVQFVHCGDRPSVMQCSRCHSLEHFTSKCPKPKDALVCAHCRGPHLLRDHDFQCGGVHPSLANAPAQ